MTFRSVILGFMGAGIVCGYTYFNDGVLRQTMFVGNHMPMSVYGGLLFALFVINPLLSLLHSKWRSVPRWLLPLSGRELAVIVALSLPACCVPYSSMLRILPKMAILPHHYERTNVSWTWRDDSGRRVSVLDYAPDVMLADVSKDDGAALTGFIQGLRLGGKPIRLRDVPWSAWSATLGFWLPLFGVIWITLTGLSLALHRQWSDHEHLPYPLVQFTRALLPGDGSEGTRIFHNRWFWIAMTAVVVFHVNNFLYVYHPEKLIEIRRIFNFGPLARMFPTLIRGGGWPLISPRFYFSAVAVAYLLATDVSLAVGIAPFVFLYIGGVLANYGIPMGGGTRFTPRIDQSLVFGGYLGMFCAVAYTGRHYYLSLFRRALGLRCREQADTTGVWGMRIFLFGFAVFVADLVLLGLDWQLSLAYAFLTIVIFSVMGRIIAETGLFFIAPYLYPCVFIFGFMGEQALGPRALIIMFILTCMILIDPRETFMPYMVNTVKLVSDSGLRLGRTTAISLVAVFFGLSIAVPVTLYLAYDRGLNWNDGFATQSVPVWAGEGAIKARMHLQAQDMLKQAETVHGWDRLKLMKPDRRSSIAFALAFAGVVLFFAGRLRFARWPLHPVMFLVWPGYAGYMMAWSFLGGCFIKTVVTRYGGPDAYQRVKPFMFGLIAGDVFAGFLVILMGLIYNLSTGELPRTYWVLPG